MHRIVLYIWRVYMPFLGILCRRGTLVALTRKSRTECELDIEGPLRICTTVRYSVVELKLERW